MADGEPGNTLYQRDLSVSYERLGAMADEAGEPAVAGEWFTKASIRRRVLTAQEPQRIDLAEELAYCLRRIADVAPEQLDERAREVIDLLRPFEDAGAITARASAILRWARQERP